MPPNPHRVVGDYRFYMANCGIGGAITCLSQDGSFRRLKVTEPFEYESLSDSEFTEVCEGRLALAKQGGSSNYYQTARK